MCSSDLFNAVRALATTRKGGASGGVLNGDFSDPIGVELLPLGWSLGTGAGVAVQVVPGEAPDQQALSVHYSGYAVANLVEQLILLAPGRYVLSVNQMLDARLENSRMAWTLRCADTGAVLLDAPLPGGETGQHATTRRAFVVPANCAAQRLRIETDRTTVL